MINIDKATFAPIAKQIQPEGQLRQVWRLSGGMSAEMVVLKIADAAGAATHYVMRWYDPTKFGERAPSLADEQRILKLIRSAGIKAPDCYLLDSSLSRFPAEYMVITFIEGEMSFAPKDQPHHISQLAQQLAQIHQIKASDYDLEFLPATSHCAELVSSPAKVNPSLREDEIRRRLGALEWPASGNEAVLLHGDFWPGNSLWQDGELQAVIDWEDARVGDPLSDLANSRLEIAWIFGQSALEQFTAAYQQLMPLNYTNLPHWDLCAALRFLRLADNDLPGMATYFHPYGRCNISADTIRAAYLAFVESAMQELPE